MPTDGLKIGIIGGYVSGKATFLNALLKIPCFRMRSNTHNHVIVQIQAGEKNVEWNYMEFNAQDWKKSRADIRFSKTYQRIQAKIPLFLWGNTVFYDFPQINDVALWKKGYIQDVSRMDGLMCILDAEYLLSETNKRILTALVRYNLNAVILNKCDRFFVRLEKTVGEFFPATLWVVIIQPILRSAGRYYHQLDRGWWFQTRPCFKPHPALFLSTG